MSIQADWIFHGGDIITMDENNPYAEALAVKGDRIIEAGKLDNVFELQGSSTTVINLNRKTLLPGFIEPHQHAFASAKFRMCVNISGYYCHTYQEIEAKIKGEVEKADRNANPLPWCFFLGWDPELIANMPSLSADFLDGFSKEIPIVVFGQSLHVAWANHKALAVAGVNDESEADIGVFVRDKNNRLTGQMMESKALQRMIKSAPPNDEQLGKFIKEQWKAYAGRGFTTVTELAYTATERSNSLLETEAASVNCPVRLALYRLMRSIGDEKAPIVSETSEMLWDAGVKLFADGSPHCGTAAVKEPYLKTDLTEVLGFPPAPDYGALNYSTERLREMIKLFHGKEQQIAIHAHGERAIEQVVNIYEEVLNTEGPKDMRHRIEHLGLATDELIARAAKLNLALSFFVCHLYFYATTFKEHILGAERTRRWSPLSLATKYGSRWTIHQDNPSFPGPPLPFVNMKTAVTRTQRDDDLTVYGPEYRVSIHDALKAYTINAAWQLHKEDILGSLSKNKKADMVILSQNPYKVDPLRLEDVQVVATFLNGRQTHGTRLTPVFNSSQGN